MNKLDDKHLHVLQTYYNSLGRVIHLTAIGNGLHLTHDRMDLIRTMTMDYTHRLLKDTIDANNLFDK